MTGKITLITPPDYYENSNFSILFLGLSEEQQEAATTWLAENIERYPEVNFYFYQGEPNAPWLLYALARSDVKFLNYDSDSAIINVMGSYILTRPNVYYTTKDDNLKALMSHINNGYLDSVTEFLEKVFDVSAK